MTSLKAAAFSVAAATLLLGGCSGGLQRSTPLPQAYVLRATASSNGAAAPAGAPSLRVGRAQTAPGLDTDRIVLVRSDHRLDYFASSRWTAAIPDVVEALAAEVLRGSGVWNSVNDASGGFPSDYLLQIQIRRFEADYTAGEIPTVYVVFDCLLGRRDDRELLASFRAEAHATAGTNRLSAVVAAFEQAANAALAEVAQRSREALAVNPPKK